MKKNQIKIKHLWLRLWGPSEIHRPLLGYAGPGPMYRLNPPPHKPCLSAFNSVLAFFASICIDPSSQICRIHTVTEIVFSDIVYKNEMKKCATFPFLNMCAMENQVHISLKHY